MDWLRTERDYSSMRKALKRIGQPDALGGLPVEIMFLTFCDRDGRIGAGQVWPRGTIPILLARPEDIVGVLHTLCADDPAHDLRVKNMRRPGDPEAIIDFRDDAICYLMFHGDRLNWRPTRRLQMRAEASVAKMKAMGFDLEDGPANGLPWVVTLPACDDQTNVAIASFLSSAAVQGRHDVIEDRLPYASVPMVEYRFELRDDGERFQACFGGKLRAYGCDLPETEHGSVRYH
jgi:hypothetical protein